MEKNYFSDITELFIKAKKTERIDVNPHSKANIREMLAYKIDEIKTLEANPKENFFNKWKFQLMGVPASLFAVFMVVFAFQNLEITMPRANEESSLEGAIATEADLKIFDEPVIEEIQERPELELKPKPEPKPELLIIDYSTTSTPPTSQPPTSTPTPKTGGGDLPSSYNPPTTTIETATIAETPETEAETPAPIASPAYIVPVAKTPSQPAPSTTNDEYIYINDNPTEDPTPEVITPQYEIAPEYEISPETVNNLMQGDILLPKTEDAQIEDSINEFRQPFYPQVEQFDIDALNVIEKTDNLSNVNVHYLNGSQAAVEVIVDDTTRWYMFETVDGTWTLTQKFD